MKRVVTFLLAAGLVLSVATPALAAPPSSDPTTDAKAAAAWLASKVNASGFIPNSAGKADYSASAQAVTALVAAGVGKTKVTLLLGYLGAHVNDFVDANGADDPGALGYLILAAKAGGDDSTSFGSAHTNLVTRLVGTQQPSGLFGSADASFDGAFREGLSLLALHSAGVSNPAGVAWLDGQQCADGAFLAFRADTAVACPAVDPATFAGPDTNSTAFAVLGLVAQGDTTAAAKAVTELGSIRNGAGGWGFLSSSSQPLDSQSTGLVLEALRTATGSGDAKGLAALLTLQVGCTGKAADQGGIAFQPDGSGKLVPNLMATVQITPALAGGALPVPAGTVAAGVPAVCPVATTTTTTTAPTTSTTVAASGVTVTTAAPASTVAPAATPTAGELPRTGSSSAPFTVAATLLLAIGGLFVAGARRRRA